jgi:hypothetical protein
VEKIFCVSDDGVLDLKLCRGRADVECLAGALHEFREAQRTIVQRAGKAETVIDERSFARLVASYMPPIWGMLACDSSTMRRKSRGKKSSSVKGREPGGRPLRWRE